MSFVVMSFLVMVVSSMCLVNILSITAHNNNQKYMLIYLDADDVDDVSCEDDVHNLTICKLLKCIT